DWSSDVCSSDLAPRARAGETSGCSSCVHKAHALTPEEQTLVNVPLWIWAVTIGAMIAILALDLVIVDRPWSKTKGPSEFGLRQASWWAVFYIALAVVFGFGVMYFGGTTAGAEYFAGFVTEKSLSIDNLFVFYLLISAFAVPRRYQHEVLLVGIVIAIVMRGIFIVLGAQIINAWSEVFYLFGAFLIWTAYKIVRDHVKGEEDDKDFSQNAVVRFIKRSEEHTSELQSRFDL